MLSYNLKGEHRVHQDIDSVVPLDTLYKAEFKALSTSIIKAIYTGEKKNTSIYTNTKPAISPRFCVLYNWKIFNLPTDFISEHWRMTVSAILFSSSLQRTIEDGECYLENRKMPLKKLGVHRSDFFSPDTDTDTNAWALRLLIPDTDTIVELMNIYLPVYIFVKETKGTRLYLNRTKTIDLKYKMTTKQNFNWKFYFFVSLLQIYSHFLTNTDTCTLNGIGADTRCQYLYRCIPTQSKNGSAGGSWLGFKW